MEIESLKGQDKVGVNSNLFITIHAEACSTNLIQLFAKLLFFFFFLSVVLADASFYIIIYIYIYTETMYRVDS